MAVHTTKVVLLLLALAFLYLMYFSVYRLFFHPLAKIPGPKLAALTGWHEFYFDCVKNGGGQHGFKMREMHDVYGPVIRINPWEVHIDGRADPAFWDVLYSNSNKLDKDQWFYNGFGAGLSMVSTGPTSLHRARRGSVSSYFSQSHVRSYETVVLQRVLKLIKRFEKCSSNDEVINLADAWRCLSTDVVTSFAVPEPRTMLDTPDFGKGFNRVIRDFSKLITLNRHLRIIFPVVLATPDWVMISVDTTGGNRQLIDYISSFRREAKTAVDRKGQPPLGRSQSILDTIFTSDEVSSDDKRAFRISEEAQNIVGAGIETTGSTLTILTYYVLANPTILTKLLDELSTASASSATSDGSLDFRCLDRLPYLQATINESLRICCPVVGRLPRLNPRAATSYTPPDGGPTYTFPPGTVMSMSMPDMHSNPNIFPDPHLFRPERWIDADAEHKALMQKYFVPFGKGSRACVGKDVARLELLLAAGNVVHTLGKRMKLYETEERDVSWAFDFFAPYIPEDSKGLRIKVM